jgi:SAM-dependent methyltransferase
MLREHLSQAHDRASRRDAIVERQVAWIHGTLLAEQTTAVLDLGCGPGLYTSRLARRGHRCVGIDYSPAAIAYARERAQAEELSCHYELRDIRGGDCGRHRYGLAMLIYGELNVFPRQTAVEILRGMREAMAEHGVLLLEVHTHAAVREMGEDKPTWYTAERGIFGNGPYLCLREHFWHAQMQAATTRYFAIELATAVVNRYAQTLQAYTQEEYRDLLAAAGFGVGITFHAGLAGEGPPDAVQPGLCAIAARKD